jgi:hypothetical protein
MALPDAHPDPPADFSSRPLPTTEYHQSIYRSHDAALGPIYFGRAATYRFDAPSREYGVLYAAADLHGAFVETFDHDSTGLRVVSLRDLRVRSLARFDPRRPLQLVDLTGAGLIQLGADARLTTGPYAIAQRWSLAFHDHPDQPDGILFRSRRDPSRLCLALFERIANVLAAASLGSLADARNAAILADILKTYGYGLVDD